MQPFLLLALLLHVWLVLMLGSAPPGTARQGQGVWGALNVTLRGPQRDGPARPDWPAVQQPPSGAPGQASSERAGGAVRLATPQTKAPPATQAGAAELGDWAAQARLQREGPQANAMAPEAALRAQPGSVPRVATAAVLPPAGPSLAEPQPQPQPQPTLARQMPAGPAPLTALPFNAVPAVALPTLRSSDSAPAVANAPPAPPAPPAERRLGAGAGSDAGLAARVAPLERVLLAPPLAPRPSTPLRLPELAAVAPVQAPSPAPSPVSVAPLPAPAAAPLPQPLPALAATPAVAAPAVVVAEPVRPTPTPTPTTMPEPPAAPSAAPPVAAPTPAPTFANTPAPATASATASASASASALLAPSSPQAKPNAGALLPGSTAGRPDAGAQRGHDVATAPSAPASAPRLNLELPRLRGGELSRQSGVGVLSLLPRPPELPDKLAREINKAAKPDCREAYGGAGLLAVVPLAIDALRQQGGCKW